MTISGAQAETCQVVPLLLAHGSPSFGRSIVVSDQMQCAVNNVQQQFIARFPAEAFRRCRGSIGADYDLAIDNSICLIKYETDHVGRLVVVQVAAIQLVDRRIINYCQRNARLADAFAIQHSLHRSAEPFSINLPTKLRIIDLDDELFCAGGSGSPSFGFLRTAFHVCRHLSAPALIVPDCSNMERESPEISRLDKLTPFFVPDTAHGRGTPR